MMLSGVRRLRYAVPAALALSGGAFAARTHSEAKPPSVSSKRAVQGKPAMIISNPDVFARKWKKFCTDGLDKLIVISDFDQTLTPQFDPSGEHARNSYSLLMTSPFVNPAIPLKEKELFQKYFPIEVSPNLTRDEKLPHMIAWSTQAQGVLVEHKLNKQQIVDTVEHGNLRFRPGFIEIFKVLAQENVPTLIFSAGLYDVIHAGLNKEFRRHGFAATPSNVHVVSNMMKFDRNGLVTGFQGSLIHVFNKNASVLLDTPFYRACQMQQRRNILLLGDSLGDVGMATGLASTEDEILRVGFLNVHVEDSLDKYLAHFDVVLTHDASLLPVELLIHQIQQ